jgi:hypothetical protein
MTKTDTTPLCRGLAAGCTSDPPKSVMAPVHETGTASSVRRACTVATELCLPGPRRHDGYHRDGRNRGRVWQRGVPTLRSVEAQLPAHLVLVHDRIGVATGDAGVISQPVRALLPAHERGASFVLEVGHDRLTPWLHVDEAEVVLQVETRGPEHCEQVITCLRAAGYILAFS